MIFIFIKKYDIMFLLLEKKFEKNIDKKPSPLYHHL